METPNVGVGVRPVSAADLHHKMNELGGAVSGTLMEKQVRLHAAGLALTIAGMLVAYRLGRRAGRRREKRR